MKLTSHLLFSTDVSSNHFRCSHKSFWVIDRWKTALTVLTVLTVNRKQDQLVDVFASFNKFSPKHFKMKWSQIILDDWWIQTLKKIRKMMVFPVYCASSIYLHVRVTKIVPMIHKNILIVFRRFQLSTEAIISDFSGQKDVLLMLKNGKNTTHISKTNAQLYEEVK